MVDKDGAHAMTPAEVLRAAAVLLSAPGAWNQHRWACDIFGDWCAPTNPAAVCWCLRGAIAHVVGSMMTEHVGPAEDVLRRSLHRDGLAQWNDTRGRTADEVVAALIAAAEMAERQAPRWVDAA
jgi:hypothetical protein